MGTQTKGPPPHEDRDVAAERTRMKLHSKDMVRLKIFRSQKKVLHARSLPIRLRFQALAALICFDLDDLVDIVDRCS